MLIILIALLFLMLTVLDRDGVLGDLVPAINILLGMVVMGGGSIAVIYVWLESFREEPSSEPERTVSATVIFKEVQEGTNRTGRSMMGYSFLVTFRTESGEPLELYTYEIEFGGLKEGMTGQLTYQGRYFVSFEETK